VTKWTTIAGCFRFWETFAIVYYLPSFFQKVYPLFKGEYGLYNAMIVAGMGFLSTIVGGLLSDKYEKKSRMTKSYICMIGSALGLPAIMLCTLVTGNFYLSLFAMAVKYLVAECWMSPAITMMQATVKPEDQGNIVSAHLFYLTIAGCISTVLLGQAANMMGAATNPAVYGKLLSIWSAIGYIGAVPAFWKAGKLYQKKMNQVEEEAQANAKLSPA
jgi:MFS family permease